MEALAAVGFAANILQFIDWIAHVLAIGSQIRRNGVTDFNLNLERTAKELRYQISRIRPQKGTTTSLSQNDQVCQCDSPMTVG
jgi:hypothetical protein